MLSADELAKIATAVSLTDRPYMVVAATSVGKTRYVPPEVLRVMNTRVTVAVPTREVARTMFATVKSDNQRMTVGYAAAGEIRYDRSSTKPQLIYATSGHVKNVMLRGIRENIPLSGVLIVDEVHTGSLDTTLVIALWHYAATKLGWKQKLIMMTATATGVKLPFDYDEHIVNIERRYKITPEYLQVTPNFNKVYEIMANRAATFHLSTSRGHILLFVPGVRAADNLARQIATLLSKAQNHLILTLHSGLDREEIEKAFSPAPKGTRKIIIATNLAESGVTIPDTALVINSMRENITDTSTLKISPTSEAGIAEQSRLRATAVRLLRETMITKNSSIQRGGRTGRTMDGIHAMMISEADYDRLGESRIPEIARIPIHKEILELYMSGIPPSILYGVGKELISAQIEDLVPLNMIVKNTNPTTLEITELGIFTGLMSLSVRPATFLFEWIKQGNSCYWGAVLAAILEGHLTSIFSIPRAMRNDETKREQHVRTYFAKYHLPDHLATLLLVWIAFEIQTRGNIKRKRSRDADKWCKTNSFNRYALKETVESVLRTMSMLYRITEEREFKDVISVLKLDMDRVLNTEPTSVTNMLSASIPILLTVYRDRVAIHTKHGQYRDYYQSTCFVNNTVPFPVTLPYDLISLNEIQSQRGKQDVILISVSTFVSYDPSLYTREAATVPDKEYQLAGETDELIIPGWFSLVELQKEIAPTDDDTEYFLMETRVSARDVTIPRSLMPRHLLGGRVMICRKPSRAEHILTIPDLLRYEPKQRTGKKRTASDADLEFMRSLEEFEEEFPVEVEREEYTIATSDKDYIPFSFADFDDDFMVNLKNECILYAVENF